MKKTLKLNNTLKLNTTLLLMKQISLLCLAVLILFSTLPQEHGVLARQQPGLIEGYLEELTPAQVRIEDYAGRKHQLRLAQNMIRTIDSVPVEWAAYKPGMPITAKLTNGQVTHLEGYATLYQNQIEFGKKVRTGVISQIDGNKVWLRLPSGLVREYYVHPNMPVFKNAQKTDVSTLYEGDLVKFYFDDVQGNFISWLEIQGESYEIKDLYKAKIQKIDHLQNELLVQDVQVYRNANWQPHQSSMSISYSADNPIYIGAQKLPREHLRLYRGSDIYFVTKPFFNKEKVDKMVIKDQYERTFSDRIDLVNVFVDELQLANLHSFSFHEGTIMIRNGRIVDKFAFQRGGDALVVADGRGGNQHQAHVIHVYDDGVSSPNLGQHQIYWGALDIIFDGSIWLKEFNVLSNHEWEFQFEDVLDLFYNNDTFIYDLTNHKQVDPTKVEWEDYAVDESDYTRQNGMNDWYGYLYVENGRVVSLYLKRTPDDFLMHRTTTGRIHNIGGEMIITLKDSKDWIPRRQMWTPLEHNLSLNLGRAMIVKEGRPISHRELKENDRVYVVRHGGTAIMVMVQ